MLCGPACLPVGSPLRGHPLVGSGHLHEAAAAHLPPLQIPEININDGNIVSVASGCLTPAQYAVHDGGGGGSAERTVRSNTFPVHCQESLTRVAPASMSVYALPFQDLSFWDALHAESSAEWEGTYRSCSGAHDIVWAQQTMSALSGARSCSPETTTKQAVERKNYTHMYTRNRGSRVTGSRRPKALGSQHNPPPTHPPTHNHDPTC